MCGGLCDLLIRETAAEFGGGKLGNKIGGGMNHGSLEGSLVPELVVPEKTAAEDSKSECVVVCGIS